MGFDFNTVEDEKDTLEQKVSNSIVEEEYDHFCDAAYDKNKDVDEMYLSKEGYFIADDYYMLSPMKYLGIKNVSGNVYHEGYLFMSVASGNSFLHIPAGEIDKKEWIDIKGSSRQSNEMLYHLNDGAFENIPIVIFQHHKGEIIGYKKGSNHARGREIVFPQKYYHCINDTQVFRGVYRAKRVSDPERGDIYELTKIFDRFYFKPFKQMG